MPRYGFGGTGGDYSQAGQDYAQFAPRKRKSVQTQATDAALSQPQYTPPEEGGFTGNQAPVSTRPPVDTSAAGQLQQQATQAALSGPTLAQLQQTIKPRGGSGTLGNIITGGTGLLGGAISSGLIGGATAAAPMGFGVGAGSIGLGAAGGAGLGAWGGPIGMGVGLLGGLIASRINKHKQNIANDITANDARQIVAAVYREQLGREPSPQEIDSHLRNAGGTVSEWINPDQYNNAIRSISTSPEALAYANRDTSSSPASSPASTTTTGAPSSSWHTDDFAAPQYTTSTPGGVMSGWDAGKWADPNHQVPKYVVGRILSQYAPDEAGFAKAVAEIQKAYPGTTSDGKDKVTIPGVGTIDVRVNAGLGGTGWAWQPLTNPDGSPVQENAAQSGPPSAFGGPIDTSWAYGGAIDTTRTLINRLMQEIATAGALR